MGTDPSFRIISWSAAPTVQDPGRCVRILDTTLRDGEQTPGVHFSVEQKNAIAKRLEAFGVDTIEAGFPASSPGDAQAVRAVAKAVRSCEIAALARCAEADIDAAADALREARNPVIHLVMGVSDSHLTHKFRLPRADALRRIRDSIRAARQYVDEVQFSFEDATRTERTFLRQALQVAIDAGATRINIADTVGCAMPGEFGMLIADVVGVADVRAIVSAHCHNDLGMATANAVTAAQYGAGQIECTVNGIGERAGNAAIEEVAAAIALKGVGKSRIRIEECAAMSAMVAEASRVPVQPNRAIVGANAFTHSSGIHQDGLLKDMSTYSFVQPEAVGATGHRFVLTARSGRSAVVHQARALGFDIPDDAVDAVYAAFIAVADRTAGHVDDDALVAIFEQAMQTESVS